MLRRDEILKKICGNSTKLIAKMLRRDEILKEICGNSTKKRKFSKIFW